MPRRKLLFAVIGAIVAFGTGILSGASGPQRASDNIGDLIKQLDDEKFVKREQARRELEAIGEPALSKLREAMSNDSLEIRRRAEQITCAISARLAKTHMKSLQGNWQLVSMHIGDAEIAPDEIKKRRLVIAGDQCVRYTGDNP